MLIRPIQKADGRVAFTCGVSALDQYFARHAWTHDAKGIARVYVLEEEDASGSILGYYNLAAQTIDRERVRGPLPGSAYPSRELPVFYIGCFAVAQGRQGHGLGSQLMGDAFRRCVAGHKIIGSVGIHLDSYDEASTRFYTGLGLEPILRREGDKAQYPEPMFIPMATILKAVPPDQQP